MPSKLKIKKLDKIAALLEGFSDPMKLIKAALPLNGKISVQPYTNFQYDGKTYDLAIISREIEEKETLEPYYTDATLYDLLALIPLGNMEISAAEIEWKGKTCLGIFIKKL